MALISGNVLDLVQVLVVVIGDENKKTRMTITEPLLLKGDDFLFLFSTATKRMKIPHQYRQQWQWMM